MTIVLSPRRTKRGKAYVSTSSTLGAGWESIFGFSIKVFKFDVGEKLHLGKLARAARQFSLSLE